MHIIALTTFVTLSLALTSQASPWTFNHHQLLQKYQHFRNSSLSRRYVTDSQIDSWISGSGPFPYAYSPPYSPSSAAKCSAGTFTSPTGPSSEDHQKREQFITRSGNQLFLNGQVFRPVGPNIYWLGLDENVNPDPSYPTQTRVLEMMGVASAMGANTIRSHTLGISFGNSLSIMTGPNTFNDAAYDSVDFAIMAAKIYGLKLVIPLVDNYNWYHGGKYQFVGWAGHQWSGQGAAITPPDVGGFFYNDTNCVNAFMGWITHHLNHVNTYTGVALKNDPTILGWETGNELSALLQYDGPAPPAWTQQIANLIKSLAPNHLVVDGTFGIWPGTGQLNVNAVDIFSDHYYPPTVSQFTNDLNEVNGVGRAFLVGEWDWTGQYGGDSIQSFTSAISSTAGAGDFFWSLFGHDTDCCTWVQHNDGYTYYYPGTTSDMVSRGQVMVQHANTLNSNDPMQVLPPVACVSPAVSTVPSSTTSSPTTTTATATPTISLPAGWTYAGCLAEPTQHSTSVRALTAYSTSSGSLTIESCVATCNTMGYTYAGAENGDECYCGNSIQNGGAAAASTDCNTPCSGNSNEICGGGWRLSLYQGSSTTPTTTTSTATPTVINGWTASGCLAEPTQQSESIRALTGSETSSSSLTVESCLQTCTSQGYTYSGMEDGNQCFCGNGISNGGAPAASSDCNVVCDGNSSEICGGSWRLSLYTRSSTATTTTLTTTASPTVISGYTASGCLAEPTQHSVSIRALTGSSSANGALTIELCIQTCSSQGYTYAGAENGNQCFCGNSIVNGATAAAASNCNTPCGGNGNEICGGSWMLSLYQSSGAVSSPSATTMTTTTTSPTSSTSSAVWTSSACVAEPTQHSGSVRALTGSSSTSGSLTLESCIEQCNQLGFTLAGAEYGDECYCGNSLSNGATVTSDTNCNMACAGNSNEICGQSWTLTVYRKSTLPAGWTASGCLAEPTQHSGSVRALTSYSTSSGSLTIESCVSACDSLGYTYAGAEYGDECYCGNTISNGASAAAASNCNMPCAGNSNEICGQSWMLSLYTKSSGSTINAKRSRRSKGHRGRDVFAVLH